MDKEELRDLIEKGESKNLEFKESLSFKNEIGETVSAFSNTCDGIILIGVSDSGKIRGVQIGKKTIEQLANFIKQNTDNSVYPDIKVVSISNLENEKMSKFSQASESGNDVVTGTNKSKNKNIIIIKIKEADEKPVFFRGNAYKRVGKSNHKMTASEIRKIAKEDSKSYCDEKICEGAELEDIDEDKVKWFLRKAKAERRLDVEPETPVKEVLERLKLMKKGKLTNASVLLFGKDVQKFFINSKIRCARFKGVESLDYIDMKVLEGTIHELREGAMKFIMQYIKHGVYFDANKRSDKWEYPLRALEEVLTNALTHREYNTSSEIQLSIYDNCIEVWNPGELPNPLTPKDLKKKHKSIPRNPLIADMLFLIRYIEKWGKGTNRIIEEMEENKLSEPKFQNLSGGFEVVLIGPGKEFEEEIEKEKLHVLDLNERQKKAIEYLKEKGRITNREYRKISNASHKTAHIELIDLVNKGILKKVGKGRSVMYKIK